MRSASGWLLALALLAGSRGVLAAGVPIEQATKEQWSAAQTTFKVGDDLYDAGQFAEAVTAYRASYEIVASPNSLLMIARALREQGKLVEAHAEFEATLRAAEAARASDAKYAATVRAAQTEKVELEAKLGRLRLESSGGARLASATVNGRSLGAAELERGLVVAPGAIRVVAQDQNGNRASSELSLAAGEERSLVLEFGPARPGALPAPASVTASLPEEPGGAPLRTMSYVAAGVGAAGLIAFGVFGTLNNSKYGELEDGCPADRCAPDRQDDIDAGRRYQLFANIGLVVGVAGIGAGAALFLLSAPAERGATARVAGSSWTVGVGPGSLRVRGRF